MAGFAKRPHSAAQHTKKQHDIDDDQDLNSFAHAGMLSGDIITSDKKVSRAVEKYEEEAGRKKPNIFVRVLSAIFPVKGDGVGESVRKIIFDIAVVAFVISGGSVLHDILDETIQDKVVDTQIAEDYKEFEEDKTFEEIRGMINLSDNQIKVIEDEKPGIQASFLELYAQNSDIVGWIRVGSKDDPIININYPVVQAEDNEYYLDHTFKKEVSKRGTIYADYRNKFDNGELSANTILYGHNMWNGDTMFAKLSRYYDGGTVRGESNDRLEFYRNHPTLTFNTLYENAEWKVFACVLFNTQEKLGEVYPYINIHDFPNAGSFNTFILDIMDRSVLWTDVDLQYGDQILTLSTCYYPYQKENADTRVAVFARKVREGENPEVDVSKAQVNYDPLKFAYQYQVEGGSWGGRKWDTSKLLSYTG